MKIQNTPEIDVRGYLKLIGRADLQEHLQVASQQVTKAINTGKFPSTWFKGMCDLAVQKKIAMPPLDIFHMREY